jgi:hypothetical protein
VFKAPQTGRNYPNIHPAREAQTGPMHFPFAIGGGVAPRQKRAVRPTIIPTLVGGGGQAVSQMGGSPGHYQGGFGGVPPPGRVSHPGQEFFRGTPPMVSGVAWDGQVHPADELSTQTMRILKVCDDSEEA